MKGSTWISSLQPSLIGALLHLSFGRCDKSITYHKKAGPLDHGAERGIKAVAFKDKEKRKKNMEPKLVLVDFGGSGSGSGGDGGGSETPDSQRQNLKRGFWHHFSTPAQRKNEQPFRLFFFFLKSLPASIR
ncbi:hypothetical protein B0H63DRAFT_271844 [Podospora didyma]|uniref:Uncharacterized protein n=1 Tax=Podospora didyma TaxID=330526 RepID=A0AAE0KEG8_9PEZI|nr:hypothetical protein B0H63DRAFT_271844 [Podospora didyma]